MEDYEIPASFECPITCALLENAVVAEDGHSYSLFAIEAWFRQPRLGPATSPLTNEELASTRLLPNHSLRMAIEQWRDRQPMAINPERLELSEEIVLGDGNHGHVVAGKLWFGRKFLLVAVKMLPAMSREEERKALERELKAHIHAARHCKGVCELYGTCEKGPRLCLVMKKYEHSLRDEIAMAEGGLDAATVCRYAYALCCALKELHDCGLVVRDIKPENILIDGYGQPVLSDFGISYVLSTGTHIVPTSIVGTCNYMPREAFDAEADGGIGPHTDVWAIACVIREMITGEMPWQGMTMMQIITAVSVQHRVPTVPDSAPAADVLLRCFSTAPRERPSATELVTAFAPLSDTSSAVSQLEHRYEELHIRNQALEEQNRKLQGELKERQEAHEAALRQANEAQEVSLQEIRKLKEELEEQQDVLLHMTRALSLRDQAHGQSRVLAADEVKPVKPVIGR
jgi:serine/threonine protein kinase